MQETVLSYIMLCLFVNYKQLLKESQIFAGLPANFCHNLLFFVGCCNVSLMILTPSNIHTLISQLK